MTIHDKKKEYTTVHDFKQMFGYKYTQIHELTMHNKKLNMKILK